MLVVIVAVTYIIKKISGSTRGLGRCDHGHRCVTLASAFALMLSLLTVEAFAQEDAGKSVLVLEANQNTFTARAEIEPASQSSKPSFHPRPIEGGKYLQPKPPAGMKNTSDSKAVFRVPQSGTLTAAPMPPQLQMNAKDTLKNKQPLRPGPDDSIDEESFPQPIVSNDRGTFASSLRPETGEPVGDQTTDSGSSRSGFGAPAARGSGDRFGSFGARSDNSPSGGDRFAPRIRTASNTLPAPPQQPVKKTSTTENTSMGLPSSLRPLGPQPGTPAAPPKQPLVSSRFGGTDGSAAISDPNNRFGADKPVAIGNGFSVPQKKENNRPFVAPDAKMQSGSDLPAGRFGANQNIRSEGGSNPAISARISTPTTPNLRANSQASTIKSDFPNSSRAKIGMAPASRQSNPVAGNKDLRNNGFGNAAITSRTTDRLGAPEDRSSLRNSPSGQRNQIRQPLRAIPVANTTSQSVINTQHSPMDSSVTSTVDRAAIEFARRQFTSLQALSAGGNGTHVKLVEMFLEPLSMDQRKQMVSQYWESYYDLASLKIATDYQQWLEAISASTQVDQMLLSAAQQMAADRRLAAEIQLGKSQSRLRDFMPNPRGQGFRPVPADQPLIEQYVTDIEKYARVRSVPTSLRGIDPMLAQTLILITQRAKTVSAARDAADQTLQAIGARQATLASAITAGQLWRDARKDMVASAVNYNQAISDFVLTLEPNRSPEQLSAFMLGTPQASSPSTGAQRTSPNPAFRSQPPVRNAVRPAAWR